MAQYTREQAQVAILAALPPDGSFMNRADLDDVLVEGRNDRAIDHLRALKAAGVVTSTIIIIDDKPVLQYAKVVR